jgi:hypothetical protein
MMDEEKSTTADDNQDENLDSKATDQQTDDKVDNLDETSKSTEQSGDDDKKSETEGKDDTPAPKFDADLDEWAEKTGRAKPESDRERELYQEIRDGQREYSRTKQAKDSQKEVDKAIQDAKPADDKQEDDEEYEEDPGERAERLITEERNLRLRGEFFNENSVTTDESKVMGEILQEKVDKAATPEAKQKAFEYWTDPSNLEDWHTLAKARLASTQDTSVIEEEAARKERARIAKESQANGTSRSAKTVTPAGKQGYNRTEFLKSDD